MWHRYAEYDPSANPTGPIVTVPPTMRKRRTIDKVRDAVSEQRFRVLQREPDGSWTLRWLDNATGVIGEPEHTSEPFADGPGGGPYGAAHDAAVDWALGIVDVENWQPLVDDDTTVFVDSLHGVSADIAWRPRTGRALVLRVEDDPHTPGLRLVTVRERWTESGPLSTPLAAYELAMFRDVGHALDLMSERFGVRWQPLADGSYQSGRSE
jgi:hypothetical protein